MARDLTTSQVDRQNILNNENAVAEIQNQTGLQGIMFEGRLRFTKAMVASFFEVEVRTIERYVSENIEEISANGYEVIKGKRLKDFLNCVLDQDVPDINVGNISNRTPQIALFDFKAFLNISMLLVESENAKVLRQIMLDIVIDFVNQRTGGSTKYINVTGILSVHFYRKKTIGENSLMHLETMFPWGIANMQFCYFISFSNLKKKLFSFGMLPAVSLIWCGSLCLGLKNSTILKPQRFT